jgi:hypothetical protein
VGIVIWQDQRQKPPCPPSDRTLRDGSFGRRWPRHFVPGYDRTVPAGHSQQALARGSPKRVKRLSVVSLQRREGPSFCATALLRRFNFDLS